MLVGAFNQEKALVGAFSVIVTQFNTQYSPLIGGSSVSPPSSPASDSADSVFSATSEPPKPALQLPPINLKVSSHWPTLTILTSDWSRTTRASPRPS